MIATMLWFFGFALSAGFLLGMLSAYNDKMYLMLTTMLLSAVMIISFTAIVSPNAGNSSIGLIESMLDGIAAFTGGMIGHSAGTVAYQDTFTEDE